MSQGVKCANCPNTFTRLPRSRRFLCDDCRPHHRRTSKRLATHAWRQRMPLVERREFYRQQQRNEKARVLHRAMAGV